MQQIGQMVGVGSRELQQPSGVRATNALMVRQRSSAMPEILSRAVDIDLPDRVWGWKETGKPRRLRRSLTAEERESLAVRRDQLEPWLLGFYGSESDDVMLALTEMFMAFSSTGGYSEEQAVLKVEGLMRKLKDHPKWAIERVCDRIGSRGYTRKDGDRYVQERTFAPSDPVFIELVENETKMYRKSFDSAVMLLTAEVER